MATHEISAVFMTQAEAERVARILVSELNIPHAAVKVSALGHEPPVTYDSSDLWAASATGPTYSLFLTEESRRAYLEELRRGRVQLSALVNESDIVQAVHLLEHSGALALYDNERELKQEAHPSQQDLGVASQGTATALPEMARRSPVRVRSYPVE